MSVSPPLSSFALELRPESGPVVGRSLQLAALQGAMEEVSGGLRCVTLEGEPGIGKTHLLEATAEDARARGMHVLTAISDEELQGPLLVARSLFGSSGARALAAEMGQEEELDRLLDALSGRVDPSVAALPPDRQLIHAYDLAAVTCAALTARAPVAILLDDVQWADQDSIRLIRYVVRTEPTKPILIVLAFRPAAEAPPEVATLIADLERLRVARRLRLDRFGPPESGELLRHVLDGDLVASTLQAIHSQAEGVPFVLEELARAYRETGLLQRIEGVWQLAPKAERLLPHSVEMLIRRRVDRLSEATRGSLAEAAVIGRTFGLTDLLSVIERVGDHPETTIAALAESLAPAVAAGLLTELPEGWSADYRFTHEQIRTFAAASLPRARRQGIHAAIVDLLTDRGDPPPEAMAMVAHHAIAAGMGEQCARYSVQAARAALERNAPDEVLRLVDESLATATNPANRVDLLRLRDDALAALRRNRERLEMLPQLAALADAIGDVALGIEVTLRRSAALRVSGDEERAVELSEQARERAREAGADEAELRACLELGQAILRSPLGEAAGPSVSESELGRAEAAYERAVELAAALGDRASEAASWRELGAIALERARKNFYAFLSSSERPRASSPPQPLELLVSIPNQPEILGLAIERFSKALDLYDSLGDQRGMMTTLISMAYVRTGVDIRFGSARRIEDLRRIVSRLHTLVRESDRERQEVQMLYGVHLYARAFGFPDLALERGRDAHRGALRIGDRDLEFLAAGGSALVHLSMGEVDEAGEWLERAATAAAGAPSPLRARDLEVWRGMLAAVSGDVAEMRARLEAALALAVEQGKPAGRCEVLSRLALEAAQLAGDHRDLLGDAERWADESRRLAATLPGDHPWTAQAEAARAVVLTLRGQHDDARVAARAALEALEGLGFRESEPPYPLHLDVILASVRVLAEGPGAEEARTLALTILQMVGERTIDEDVRVRWFRAPIQRALVELAGPVDVAATVAHEGPMPPGIGDREAEMLRMITDGLTNREIADALDLSEDEVARELAALYAKLGVESRAGATVFALMQGVA